ncbi:MAG: TM0106 family RecB-like putative nuclease [Cyanobacteria bacterium J06627_15]
MVAEVPQRSSSSLSQPRAVGTGGMDRWPLLEPLLLAEKLNQPTSSTPLQWVSDDTLFQLQRCQRRAFLDRHGDPDHQNEPSEYLLKIREDSALHRRTVLQAYAGHERPRYPRSDWLAGARATQALMAQGVSCIHNGVLTATVVHGGHPPYLSKPDLLVKQPGPSWLGDWHYVPIDIRLGKKPKPEYQLVVAFHALLLSAFQGQVIDHGWLVLKEKRYRVDLDKQMPLLLDGLADCGETFARTTAPEVFISRSRCDMCVWLPHCYEAAQAQQHLSLLPGVTLSRYRRLKPLGLTSVAALAALTPAALSQIAGFERDVAQKLVVQAQSTMGGCAIARPHPPKSFALTPTDLPSAPYELYFDIEAAPDKNLVYLHGVLAIETATGQETFIPLIAERPEDEARAWQQFQYVMAEYPGSPVYHFCPYEAQTVRRLAQEYGAIIDIEALLTRFVDIHQRITASVVLPVESYALKPIARWMGFDWRDEEANGAQSICWYDNWISECDRTYLDLILRYNEDDCRATYQVKKWLSEFAQPYWAQLD